MKPTTQNRIAPLNQSPSIPPMSNPNPLGVKKTRLRNHFHFLGSVFGLAMLFAFTSVNQKVHLQQAASEWIGKTANELTCQLPAPATLSAERTGTSTAYVEWSAVQDAESYNLVVYNLSTAEVVYYSTGSSTNATVSGLQNGITYRCTVAAICSGGSTSSFIIWEDILD
jgi:hypothetical protein